ncbi:uncharacterized protein TrAFT101_009475 [Trichoderma asperellum]|uniref:uncharacterized protein n=1 Tax=Trichoderma asperellum TaxID=101201 RepID=UPI003321C879|nr:hypothetical protein TrAFT101_009475 [Trichoderma asperellum]
MGSKSGFAKPAGIAMLAMSSLAFAASLTQVSNWGNTDTGVSMYIYVPDRVATNPPVIVAIHPCGGSAKEYFTLTRLPSYADSLGFILIYPQTTKDSNCWDCYSSASNTHNGGSDSKAIVAMVTYTLSKYNGDASKVFSALAEFQPGASRMQPPLHHPHQTRAVPALRRILQRSNGEILHALSMRDTLSGYTKIVYGDGTRLVGYSAAGVGHFVPFHETDVLNFFDLLDGTSTGTSTQPSGPASTSGASGGPSCTAAHWVQCGGIGYSGCTVCASPYSCQVLNNYYSQCL